MERIMFKDGEIIFNPEDQSLYEVINLKNYTSRLGINLDNYKDAFAIKNIINKYEWWNDDPCNYFSITDNKLLTILYGATDV